MDSYDFNICVQRVNEDVWEYTVAQEFDEQEVEMLGFGETESLQEAVQAAVAVMRDHKF